MKPVEFDEQKEEIANYLSEQLKLINPGNESASEYHITMLCILEFIFYPDLSTLEKKQKLMKEERELILYITIHQVKDFYMIYTKNMIFLRILLWLNVKIIRMI